MACGSCRGPRLETAGRQLCCPVSIRPVGVGSPEGWSLVLVPPLLGPLPSVLPSHGPWRQARGARRSRPLSAAPWLPPPPRPHSPAWKGHTALPGKATPQRSLSAITCGSRSPDRHKGQPQAEKQESGGKGTSAAPLWALRKSVTGDKGTPPFTGPWAPAVTPPRRTWAGRCHEHCAFHSHPFLDEAGGVTRRTPGAQGSSHPHSDRMHHRTSKGKNMWRSFQNPLPG